MTQRRRIFLIVGLAFCVVSVAYFGFGIVDPPQFSSPDEPRSTPAEESTITPVENGTALWPYTSKSRSTTERTLAINLVITGHPGNVRTALLDRSELGYEELDEEEEAEADGETYRVHIEENDLEWDSAQGSTRYVYADPPGRQGRWLTESYQLHSGEYLGSRDHVRAYEDPRGEWTAIQVHQEYFDLFRLRHTVTGLNDPVSDLETEFIGQPFVNTVQREYHGTEGRWSDGWLTVIDLGFLHLPADAFFVALLFGSFVSGETRRATAAIARNFAEWSHRNLPGYVMFGSLIGLVLAVRSIGILLERTLTDLSPQVFATGLYPLLAIGPLVIVVALAHRLDPLPAFGFAAVGLGTAFTLDMLGMGMEVVPVRLVLHRVGLMLSLGLLALGIAHRASDEPDTTVDVERVSLATIGFAAWVVGLALPLLDVI